LDGTVDLRHAQPRDAATRVVDFFTRRLRHGDRVAVRVRGRAQGSSRGSSAGPPLSWTTPNVIWRGSGSAGAPFFLRGFAPGGGAQAMTSALPIRPRRVPRFS